MKLLIVDDHAAVRTMIRQIAALPGVQVRECGSGEQSIIDAREFLPDVVTMDLRLPGIGGIEAACALRIACPSARVVIFSSYDGIDLRKVAAAAGAVDFVSKDNIAGLKALLARLSAGSAAAPGDITRESPK